LTSITSPKYSPIHRAGDVAARILERTGQRDLVRRAGDADRIRLGACVERVAHDVRGGEAREHVEARRAQAMIVEPQHRGRHLRRLVRVQHGLRLAEPEAQRVAAGLPSLRSATKPPCRWVISRT